MTEPVYTTRKVGLFSIQDTGAPVQDGQSYTTLVIIHGFTWHRGVFSRLLPLAAESNARIVLVNRRDYPDSAPYTEEEHRLLISARGSTPEAAADLKEYIKARARELYNFLSKFVTDEDIAVDSLVLAGWSFGSAWMLALLTHAATFPVNDVELDKYIRRVILYDPPYHAIGYDPPEEFYNPLSHPSLAPGEGAKIFPAWVSGYYAHGDSASELEHRIALAEPTPTILTMSPEDIQAKLHAPPAIPGGSDDLLVVTGIQHGLYDTMRRATLFFANPGVAEAEAGEEEGEEEAVRGDWKGIELRYIWCDRSVWEVPWGTWALQAELQEARKAGKETRNVVLVRLKGANHFVHWDQPERALRALLADSTEDL
ncbi:alpha/beta-hydrolase [Stereum hirsutum FP-91666 SS1]|uniref:alpha/beta-hydrolase n=1 Tax=Stereum hirsutum (strain FP-91666) TaxID=721885 RepID=UPI000444A695|nr:alpha/beta-hydrolase [Stereum hirsutum FP-91666 SS1]EIM81598.1 alpha/beta-hydrolase [Stereum hirsutum FP-91666 SS1]